MSDDNIRELCRREEKLFGAKASIDALRQELAYNFYPERADFTTERSLGSEFAIDLFDSEPLRCRRDLANARASMLRPSSQEWFKPSSGDEKLDDQPDIARWLDMVGARARTLIYHDDTGFVRAEKEADHDIVTFGEAIKTAESEIDRTGKRIMLVRDWHPRDCAYLDDRNGIRQDFMARRFKASARHIKQQFPDADLHDSIKNALEKDKDQEFRLCHVMMRSDEYEYYKKPKGRKSPWVSVYYDSQNKMLLRERPSARFRYVVDRWGTLQGSQYGYSPAAMTALPDARGMQTMALVLLEAGEKSLDPPLKVVQRAIKGDIRQGAGEITFVDRDYDEKTGPAIEPLLPNDYNPRIGIDLINRTTLALRDTWFLTKLTLPQGAKTAYETAQLVEEFIRANIPLFEPWQAGTSMMLDEIFEVLIDMGAFGPFESWPKALSGRNIEWEFKNPLQSAIARNKANYASSALGLIAGAAQINPNAPGARRIDVDAMVVDAVRGLGAPAEWIIDEEQAAATAQAETQKANILQALQGAGQAADIVKTGTEAAANLQQMNQPAADGSAVYGPS